MSSPYLCAKSRIFNPLQLYQGASTYFFVTFPPLRVLFTQIALAHAARKDGNFVLAHQDPGSRRLFISLERSAWSCRFKTNQR